MVPYCENFLFRTVFFFLRVIWYTGVIDVGVTVKVNVKLNVNMSVKSVFIYLFIHVLTPHAALLPITNSPTLYLIPNIPSLTNELH